MPTVVRSTQADPRVEHARPILLQVAHQAQSQASSDREEP